jgi:hypothetical protein
VLLQTQGRKNSRCFFIKMEVGRDDGWSRWDGQGQPNNSAGGSCFHKSTDLHGDWKETR